MIRIISEVDKTLPRECIQIIIPKKTIDRMMKKQMILEIKFKKRLD